MPVTTTTTTGGGPPATGNGGGGGRVGNGNQQPGAAYVAGHQHGRCLLCRATGARWADPSSARLTTTTPPSALALMGVGAGALLVRRYARQHRSVSGAKSALAAGLCNAPRASAMPRWLPVRQAAQG